MHSPLYRCLGCFALKNSAALNILVHAAWWTCALVSLDCTSVTEVAGLWDVPMCCVTVRWYAVFQGKDKVGSCFY